MLNSGPVPANDEVAAGLRRQTEALKERALATVGADHRLWAAGKISLDTLCIRAGDAFDACADAIFDAVHALPPGEAPASLRQQYRRAVLGAAHAIRDAITDSTARHAVAQTLQTRMLHVESRSRKMIDHSSQ